MKTSVKIPVYKSWDELVSILGEEDLILLKGPDHYLLAWEFTDGIRFARDAFSPERLETFLQNHTGNYVVGFLGYDCKNQLETELSSENRDPVDFPDAFFRVPQHVITFRERESHYHGSWSEEELMYWLNQPIANSPQKTFPVNLVAMTSPQEYLNKVGEILREIQQGNIYEINYCVNFTGQTKGLNTFETFRRLNELADAPFSAYLTWDNLAVMSASPERYIQKQGNKLITQPIKGTARRDPSPAVDEQIREKLKSDPKERSENIMIVDLVRNDLSRIAEKNSVRVDELCEVYSFRTVHQLISTVSCDVREGTSFREILKASFPMGSMTGAPKISAMQISERVENFRRGLYSGTIGYMDPQGNFDFNVVIRSILYNRNTGVVSCGVGGAITIASVPEKEHEECLLKLQALQKALC